MVIEADKGGSWIGLRHRFVETEFVAKEHHVGTQRGPNVTDCLAHECVQLVWIDRHDAPPPKYSPHSLPLIRGCQAGANGVEYGVDEYGLEGAKEAPNMKE